MQARFHSKRNTTRHDAERHYSVETHLFQTGTSNSLPMPLVGVGPNANNLPWGLSAPAEGPTGKGCQALCSALHKVRYKFLP